MGQWSASQINVPSFAHDVPFSVTVQNSLTQGSDTGFASIIIMGHASCCREKAMKSVMGDRY